MRRSVVFLVAVSLLLCGCSISSHNIKEPVNFFYPKSCSGSEDYKNYFSDGAIGSEIREASGHRNDLYYLLSMYFRGPLDSQLVSLFPAGCTLVKVQQSGQDLTVILNAYAASISDLDQALAIGCLAKTCMALADVSTVHIESWGINNTMLFQYTVNADTHLWEDMPPASAAPEESTQ